MKIATNMVCSHLVNSQASSLSLAKRSCTCSEAFTRQGQICSVMCKPLSYMYVEVQNSNEISARAKRLLYDTCIIAYIRSNISCLRIEQYKQMRILQNRSVTCGFWYLSKPLNFINDTHFGEPRTIVIWVLSFRKPVLPPPSLCICLVIQLFFAHISGTAPNTNIQAP